MSQRQEGIGDDVANRLSRVAGHANSLKRFWDEGRDCDAMLTQISAVRGALDQISKIILEHHLEHCIREAVGKGDPDDIVRDLKKSLGHLF